MALSYKARKRWALIILLLWMPVFIVLAVVIIGWLWPDPLNRPPILAEFLIYVGTGLACFLPFRKIFLGIGQPDPDAGREG